MKINLTSIQTSVDAIRAVFPPTPSAALRQPVNRAIQLLPRLARWRHLPWAMLLGLLGLAFAVAVVLTRSDLLAIGAGFARRRASGQTEKGRMFLQLDEGLG